MLLADSLLDTARRILMTCSNSDDALAMAIGVPTKQIDSSTLIV
jgi:hypothetical protein